MRHAPPLALLSLLVTGCTAPITFTARAVESLPQVAVESDGLTSGRSITTELQLRNLFRKECFSPGDANYCPAGTDTSGGMSNPFKFTSTSLLGLIFHAELYSGGHRTACTGKKVSLTPANLKTTTAGGDGMRFLLDTLALYSCTEVTDEPDKPRHRAYSVAPDYQATLTLDDHVDQGGGPRRTAAWQVYTGLDAKQAPTFLAFNYAAVSSMLQRTVLLVNLQTHRFAIKYLTPPPAGETKVRFVTAIGVGGVDRGTGAGHPGYYFAHYSDDETQTSPDESVCVDNATQLIELDDSECRNAGVPVDWSSSDAVATWLGMSSAEQSRLASFLAKFTDRARLPLADTPTAVADAENLFPVRIE